MIGISSGKVESIIDSAVWYLSERKYNYARRRLYIALLQGGANTWKADHLATRAVELWMRWEGALDREDELYESYGEHAIVVETDLAIAVDDDLGGLQWFPKSVVKDSEEMRVGEKHELEVKQWFLEKEGLV